MKVERIEVDSAVLGRSVLAISDLAPADDLAAEEVRYLEQFHPAYVYCRVALENLATVHRLERHGFEFIECQIRSTIRFTQDYDVSRYPYEYQRVETREALDEVLDIASNTVVHDRFTMDPAMPPGISGTRYRRYVEKSFSAPDEAVWRLYDPASKQTLNFRTHRATAPGEALLLLGGVHPEFKNLGLGVIASYFCFNQMRRDGFRRAVTHISAINYPVFNLEIGSLGFRVNATFAVLRKVYP
jgi:ribosomal protein S18 acetylase RimI-like enzyme